MNHDYAHCLDYQKGKCPKKCFRAQLVEDMENRIGEWFTGDWAHLDGTQYCEKEKNG